MLSFGRRRSLVSRCSFRISIERSEREVALLIPGSNLLRFLFRFFSLAALPLSQCTLLIPLMVSSWICCFDTMLIWTYSFHHVPGELEIQHSVLPFQRNIRRELLHNMR